MKNIFSKVIIPMLLCIIFVVLSCITTSAITITLGQSCFIGEDIYSSGTSFAVRQADPDGSGLVFFMEVGKSKFAKYFQSFQGPTEEVAFKLGDVDKNGLINIKDATLIQKSLVEMATLSGMSTLAAADVDFSEAVNVRDATAIQKHIAGYCN